MKIFAQTINLLALMVSGFVVGYIVGLNPQITRSSTALSGHAEAGAVGTVAETFVARVTAYCPGPCCCGQWADGVTANGHKIRPGERFVAADKRFAFGTMLTIPGYNEGKPVQVLDRGGAIKGNCIDVFFDDDPISGKSGHQRALDWGVENLVVTVTQ